VNHHLPQPRGRGLAWFVVGCFTGCAATVAGLGVWLLADDTMLSRLLEEPVTIAAPPPPQPPGSPVEPEPAEAAADPEPELAADVPEPPAQPRPEDCPPLRAAVAPWLPEALSEGTKPAAPITAPKGLERRVQFWEALWGKHPDRTWLILDSRSPWVVHDTVDCRPIYAGSGVGEEAEKQADALCRQRVGQAKAQVIHKLRREKRRPKGETLKLYDGQRGMARSAYRRVMLIEGHQDSLAQAVTRAEPYLATIERIFASRGLPIALARLSIVESLFELEVRSGAGAVGVFQFMAPTAREYKLKVSGDLDERRDPLRSSYAAARYLEALNRQFKSWALALTSYNTGPGRMESVIRARRSRDIVKIAEGGTLGAFGFDGQNYFAQFIAVQRLTEGIKPKGDATPAGTARVTQPMPFAKLAACLGAPAHELARVNPALLEGIAQRKSPVPKGYLVNLPTGVKAPDPAVDGEES